MSTGRAVLIAAVVAFVVGCVPALATALVAVDTAEREGHRRGLENCYRANEVRQALRVSVREDIKTYKQIAALAEQRGAPSFPIIEQAWQVKREEVLPRLQDRDCPRAIREAERG